MAQDFSKTLEGKVYSEDGDVAATHVLNTTTKKAAITDINGFFSIAVRLNDTLVFSAVQYKRKEIVVNASILDSKFLSIPLEESNIALDEVIVMPYNLTGELGRDMRNMDVEPVISASSLGLPNAYVKISTQAERSLYAATANPLNSIDPLINAISGRTKMLKKRVARDIKYNNSQQLRTEFADSLFVLQLKIPMEKIDDFLYYCEVDANFNAIVSSQDLFAIWDFIKQKSLAYRKNNGME
nr:carboxypeptidase-like regulatory domain-containing protein [Arenibacter sp. F26102]